MIKRYLFLTILIFATFASLAPLYAVSIPDEEWAFMDCGDGYGLCIICSQCSVDQHSGKCTTPSCDYEYGRGESIGTEVDLPVGDGVWLLLIGALGYMLYVRQRRVRKVHKVIKL